MKSVKKRTKALKGDRRRGTAEKNRRTIPSGTHIEPRKSPITIIILNQEKMKLAPGTRGKRTAIKGELCMARASP